MFQVTKLISTLPMTLKKHLMAWSEISLEWDSVVAEADPGFPRGVRQPLRGEGANLLFDKFFHENCMKMKILVQKGRSSRPLDPPLCCIASSVHHGIGDPRPLVNRISNKTESINFVALRLRTVIQFNTEIDRGHQYISVCTGMIDLLGNDALN